VRDDGRVREILDSLPLPDGFERPPGGVPAPHNVIEGRIGEGRVWMFEHVRRTEDGVELPFHVVLLETEPPLPDDLRIHGKPLADGDAAGKRMPHADAKSPCELRARGRFVEVSRCNEGRLEKDEEMEHLLANARRAADRLREEIPAGHGNLSRADGPYSPPVSGSGR